MTQNPILHSSASDSRIINSRERYQDDAITKITEEKDREKNLINITCDQLDKFFTQYEEMHYDNYRSDFKNCIASCDENIRNLISSIKKFNEEDKLKYVKKILDSIKGVKNSYQKIVFRDYMDQIKSYLY